jgi:hypothetical protein
LWMKHVAARQSALESGVLRMEADDTACPVVPDARCTGTTANNAFFGEGIADALDAVH